MSDDPPELRGALSGPAWEPRSRVDRHRRTTRRKGRRNRRVRRLLYLLIGSVIAVGAIWIAVTALLARTELTNARANLTAVKAAVTHGDKPAATAAAGSFRHHADRAHTLTTGPAWWLAAQLPWLGEPFTTTRGLTTESATLGNSVLPGVLSVASTVNTHTLLQGGTIDIAQLRAAAPAVHTAALALAAATRTVSQLPAATWLPPINTAQKTVSSQLGGLNRTLRSADQALQVLPAMLGGNGTTRYFVAFENEAELRGTGGLPGAFAIVTATNGTISFERFASDDALANAAVNLNFGPDYNKQYGPDLPYAQYGDSNESPHFPYAAQIWAAMWEKRSGQKVNGAIAVDPTAMGYLLTVTGGATLPDGQQVTGANFAALTQKDVYAKFPANDQNLQRKQYLIAIAELAAKRVLSGAGGTPALVEAASKAANEGRILMWSSDPKVQAVLAENRIGGVVPETRQPYSQVSINNGGGNKLDYYLDRSVTVVRGGCGAVRNVKVTITLTNTAPPEGLPPYVIGRADKPNYATVPGQNRLVIDYIATNGTQLRGVSVDGRPSGVAVYAERGHPSYRSIVELRPGQTTAIVLELSEPASSSPLQLVAQPGVRPLKVQETDVPCG